MELKKRLLPYRLRFLERKCEIFNLSQNQAIKAAWYTFQVRIQNINFQAN